jgi:hypothetical protein
MCHEYSSYDRYGGMKLAGIIYLHEISQSRFEISRMSLVMLNKLCGNDALSKVILVTTKWGDISADVGQRREQQLADTYWKEMLDKGSEMARFMNTPESAWAIVDLIVSRDPADALVASQETPGYHEMILPDLQLSGGVDRRYSWSSNLEKLLALVGVAA